MLDSLKRQLCDIQGRLFELALRGGYDCPRFMELFMTGETAAHMDLEYDRTQWAGEEYLLEEVNALAGGLPRAGEQYGREAMYWSGYLYRYWHFLTGESSAEIYRQAPAGRMAQCYAGFHTLDPDMAIEDLKELHRMKEGS